MSAKAVERIIQGYSKRAFGFIISRHSLRTTYVSRSVELEQSPSVVMANTGDSPATILKYYAKLPEVVMRRSSAARAAGCLRSSTSERLLRESMCQG